LVIFSLPWTENDKKTVKKRKGKNERFCLFSCSPTTRILPFDKEEEKPGSQQDHHCSIQAREMETVC